MRNIAEFDIISLKCCFRIEEKRMSEENCTTGSKSGWHNKPPPQTEPLPHQNNVSLAKQLPAAPSAKKIETRHLTLSTEPSSS